MNTELVSDVRTMYVVSRLSSFNAVSNQHRDIGWQVNREEILSFKRELDGNYKPNLDFTVFGDNKYGFESMSFGF